jgi:cytochrome b-561
VHRLSAHLMVAAVFLHLVRVFLTGAYKNGTGRGQRREWNWVLGVAMLLLTLFLSFTGYLLPWDQLAYWAVTVGTNIASSIPLVGPRIRELMICGRTIDQPTLIRFYVLHILVLPAALGALFAYHMWRVRKDGGLARADREALLKEKNEEPKARSKTYTRLGVARGTAPTIRATTLEAPDLQVNAIPT